MPPHSGAVGAPVRRRRYGADDQQFGDLYEPVGPARPGVVVLLHGGFWHTPHGLELTAPSAADLAARGHRVWNLEYRRVGAGGGWPATGADVASAVDALADLATGPGPVLALGHSAGGQLAAWAAARRNPRVAVDAVVSLAGVLDLDAAAESGVAARHVLALLGGPPAERAHLYADASPRRHVPLAVPVRCLHSRADEVVPAWHSLDYVRAARGAGADAQFLEVPGGHADVRTPGTPAWAAVAETVAGLTA